MAFGIFQSNVILNQEAFGQTSKSEFKEFESSKNLIGEVDSFGSVHARMPPTHYIKHAHKKSREHLSKHKLLNQAVD